MIKTAIFQKYFVIALGCLVSFVIFGLYFNGFLLRTLISKPTDFAMNPPIFVARLIDRLNENDKIAGVKELAALQSDFHMPNMVLVNESGHVLYPEGFQLNFEWNTSKKPEGAYQFTAIDSRPELGSGGPMSPPIPPPMAGPLGGYGLPPGGPPPDGFRGPDGPRPPHLKSYLIRLSGAKPIYLYLMPPKFNGMDKNSEFGPGGHLPLKFFGFISLIVSLALGVGVAISLIYFSVNKKVIEADNVISQIQNGNLKARFVVKRKDEFGQAMMRFNTMADEIEKLVEHLRAIENSRTKLLQELAHDLRTPIASLKSLLETMHDKADKLDTATKNELMQLSMQEVSYFERLVEDLLFLSQVAEPRYLNERKTSLIAVLKDEVENLALRYKHNDSPIEFSAQFESNDMLLAVDENLLRRLFRNALENAASFATKKVSVSIQVIESSSFKVSIEDDGPGFSEDVLLTFGERRVSRKLEKGRNNRISVGLGSVVMKTICNSIKAQLRASNKIDDWQKISGAKIEVEFQKA